MNFSILVRVKEYVKRFVDSYIPNKLSIRTTNAFLSQELEEV